MEYSYSEIKSITGLQPDYLNELCGNKPRNTRYAILKPKKSGSGNKRMYTECELLQLKLFVELRDRGYRTTEIQKIINKVRP